VFVLERKTKMAAGLKVSKEVAGKTSLSRKKKKALEHWRALLFQI